MPSTPRKEAESRKTKPSATKRASLPRESLFASDFKKDFNRHNDSGRAPMVDVKMVMSLLVDNSAPLGKRYKDHALSGKKWQGHRECHVHGDLLLVYKIDGGTVIFVALGTHSELFGG